MLRRAEPGGAAAAVALLGLHNAAALGSAPLGVVVFATDSAPRSGRRAPRLVPYAQPAGARLLPYGVPAP